MERKSGEERERERERDREFDGEVRKNYLKKIKDKVTVVVYIYT